MKPTKLRSCLEFISSLVKNYFRVDLSSLGAANSGLFARTKRIKMPERILNKQKSPIKYILAVNSRQLLTTLSLAMAVLLGACGNKSDKIHCRIKGTVPDSTYTMMLLAPSGSDFRVVDTDSIPVVDGKFTFDLYVDEVMPYELVSMEEHNLGNMFLCEFFAEEGTINVTFYHYERDAKRPTVKTKSPTNTKFLEFDAERMRRIAPILQQLDSLNSTGQWDSPRMGELNERYYTTLNKCAEDFIRHDGSIIGLYLLMFQAVRMPHSDTDDLLYTKLYKEIYQPLFPDHPLSMQLEEWIESRSIKVGNRYIDFTAPALDGTLHTLSKEIDGKIALIDLWASWCGPCRRESMSMKPLYESYKDKGFTIVGVAREQRREDMEAAIKKDGYPWLCLLELNDAGKIWEKYGVGNGGGAIFMVDREGKILAIKPSAEEVKAILEKML